MNLTLKAILFGIAIESALAAIVAFGGGFGPCGPANLIGFIGMLGHFPGLLVIAVIPESWPTWFGYTIVAAVQAIIYTAIVFCFLKSRARTRKNN